MLPLAAFAGALAVITLTYGGSKRGGRIDTRAMLLLGVVASAFLWAVQTLVLTLAGKSADTVLRWSFGSLANADWPTVALMVVPAAIGLALLAGQSYTMNLFSLGETEAMRLGVSVERFKAIIIFAGSLLTAASVASSGIIAFVGWSCRTSPGGSPARRTTALCCPPPPSPEPWRWSGPTRSPALCSAATESPSAS